MKLSTVLRLLAPVFFLVGALHLALGVGAEVLLGAELPREALADPALDSNNRFYGVSFTLYGLLLFVGAKDLRRHASMLRCVIWTLFAAGLARIVSMLIHGAPPPPVLGLLVIEIVTTPLLAWWLSREIEAPETSY